MIINIAFLKKKGSFLLTNKKKKFIIILQTKINYKIKIFFFIK